MASNLDEIQKRKRKLPSLIKKLDQVRKKKTVLGGSMDAEEIKLRKLKEQGKPMHDVLVECNPEHRSE